MGTNKVNCGTFSKNQRKKEAKHPDANGSLKVCCENCGAIQDFWMAGWIKDGKNGRFSSISLTYIKDSLEVSGDPNPPAVEEELPNLEIRPEDDELV